MLTLPEMRDLAAWLARAASVAEPEASTTGLGTLEHLEGREWLLLDHAARSSTWRGSAAARGAAGLGAPAGETTGFVAAVTSLHVDGRIRQRATRVLGRLDGPVPAAALAVRLLDHMPEVRAEALAGLRAVLDASTAAVALDVLLAGRGRLHAPTALAAAQEVLLESLPAAELVTTLLAGDRRDVRRWAFALGRDRFTSSELLELVRSDPDQWLRTAAAGQLMDVADRSQLQALLVARSVEPRLVALTRLPDDALSDDALSVLLTDRAPRVREQARWRARRRGRDVAGWYRAMIGDPDLTGRALAAGLDGLVATGGVEDVDRFLDHLRHPLPRARAAAIAGVGTHGSPGLAVPALGPMLVDPSPRVTSAAARTLIRLQVPLSVVEPAWTSTQPWSRRAAWRISRETSRWDRVEADLRALTDAEPSLAGEGLNGIHEWLRTSAATTWGTPSDAQRHRIEAFLAHDRVDAYVGRLVAFHSGIAVSPPDAQPEPPPEPSGQTDSPPETPRWRRWVRRRPLR